MRYRRFRVSAWLIIAMLGGAALLPACSQGQRGDLYLPEKASEDEEGRAKNPARPVP